MIYSINKNISLSTLAYGSAATYLTATHQLPEASLAAASNRDRPMSVTVGAIVKGVMYFKIAPINPETYVAQYG